MERAFFVSCRLTRSLSFTTPVRSLWETEVGVLSSFHRFLWLIWRIFFWETFEEELQLIFGIQCWFGFGRCREYLSKDELCDYLSIKYFYFYGSKETLSRLYLFIRFTNYNDLSLNLDCNLMHVCIIFFFFYVWPLYTDFVQLYNNFNKSFDLP